MLSFCVSVLLRRSMTPRKTPVLSAVKPAFAPVLLEIIYFSHNIATRTIYNLFFKEVQMFLLPVL